MKGVSFYAVNGSDANLVSLYKGGNELAGAALFNRYFASVRRTIVSIVKDADAANNIEVEAFLAVFHSIRENREPVAEFSRSSQLRCAAAPLTTF